MPQYIKVTIKQNVCMFAHIHLEKYSSTEAFTGNQDGQGVARMNSKALFMVIIFVGFSSSSSPVKLSRGQDWYKTTNKMIFTVKYFNKDKITDNYHRKPTTGG